MERSKVTAMLRSYDNLRVFDLICNLITNTIVDDLVVVTKDQDKVDTRERMHDHPFSSRIIPVYLEKFGWSRWLNEGTRALPPQNSEKDLLLCISNEVNLLPEKFKEMQRSVLDNADALVSYVLFAGRLEPSYHLPRNTCCLWRRSHLEQLGGFYERLDLKHFSGMEDVEMALRGFEFKNWRPYLGAKEVDLEIRKGVDMVVKTGKEEDSVKKINSLYDSGLVTTFYQHLEAQAELNGVKTSLTKLFS